ncbi:MAG: 3-dehydroquinate synthase [Desulfitobacteriaceae bacterium]|nr:3-dehydroquinate synthase [Desulfitobacteriaceae bacterium]MDD4347146.1 3-dehydroquinate synthase [Desulfitobacteriaceae bacterium]
MNWQRIEVASNRPYPIFLGVPLEGLGEYLQTRSLTFDNILIISTPNVADRYLDRLMEGLKDFVVNTLSVPDGEEQKSLARIAQLTTEAMGLGVDRRTLVIALGGGVIGDLGGFFASIFMRGIRLVQVPTTLLAQVDSSIGGKVAVNHPAGKNLLGSFYPPMAVWTDFSTLETLPWSEVQNGLAETIKHALIADRDLFEYLEKNLEAIRRRDMTVWKEMAGRSLAVKVKKVSEDELEQGSRALLNLGHSFGHALETELEYKGITHGQGVSAGLVAAACLANSRGMLNSAEVERIVNLLKGFDLITKVDTGALERLMEHMKGDKKNQAGKKILILPKGLGLSVIVKDCTDQEILLAWQDVT